jgi:hypothetical protein
MHKRNLWQKLVSMSLSVLLLFVFLFTIPLNPVKAQDGEIDAEASAVALPQKSIWKVALLVYESANLTFTDTDGTVKHLVANLPRAEKLKATQSFRQYASLGNELSNNEAIIQYDIIHISTPIRSVTSLGESGYWVSPTDIEADLDTYAPQGKYDSILVHWNKCNADKSICVPSYGWGWGLIRTDWANGSTYCTVTEAEDWMWDLPRRGEVWLHEWLHGSAPFYEEKGYPMPENNADGGSGHGYEWSETDGWSNYYRDLMTGRVLENGTYKGITPEAWRSGSIIGTKRSVFSDYYYDNTLSSYEKTGTVTYDSANEQIRLGTSTMANNYLYKPTSLNQSFVATGRVYVPANNVGIYDSVALALKGGSDTYWATLAYGTGLAEKNNISIIKNDSWGTLAPLTLNPGWYTIKIQVDYSQNIIRMKAWADGTNEPDWQTSRNSASGWRASSIGFRHYGQGSIVDDIFVDMNINYPPSAPTLVRPAKDATNQALTVSLKWNASTDAENDPVKYDVYFGESSTTMSVIASNLTATTFNKSGLESSKTYYWRIRAKDSFGSRASAIWNFSTYKVVNAPNNLAKGKIVTGSNITGTASTITDGQRFSEGAPLSAAPSVKFNAVSSWAKVDLGAKKNINYVQVQISENDSYLIQVSENGTNWTKYGTTTAGTRSGFYSKKISLAKNGIRYVRVKPVEGDGKYYISEVVVN